ncbi:MAG: hypothetical protein ACI8VT_004307, partial [Saprospiraceae bacterium]
DGLVVLGLWYFFEKFLKVLKRANKTIVLLFLNLNYFLKNYQ